MKCPKCRAKEYLESKGVFGLDTKKRYNEVIGWMEEYAREVVKNCSIPAVSSSNGLKKMALLKQEKEIYELAELLMQSENLEASAFILRDFAEKCYQEGAESTDKNNLNLHTNKQRRR